MKVEQDTWRLSALEGGDIMVQIGKHILFVGKSREQLSDLLGQSNAKVDITWLGDTEANVFGDSVDFQNFIDFVQSNGITITVLGDIPIPTQPPAETPPTQEEIDNQNFAEQAFKDEEQKMVDDFWTRVNTKYTALGGTGQVRKFRGVRLIR